jgi:hypothetical protein
MLIKSQIIRAVWNAVKGIARKPGAQTRSTRFLLQAHHCGERRESERAAAGRVVLIIYARYAFTGTPRANTSSARRLGSGVLPAAPDAPPSDHHTIGQMVIFFHQVT